MKNFGKLDFKNYLDSYDDPNEQKNKEKAIVLDAIDDLDDVPLRSSLLCVILNRKPTCYLLGVVT